MDILSAAVYAAMTILLVIEEKAMSRWKASTARQERAVAKTKARTRAFMLLIGSIVLLGALYLFDQDNVDKLLAWVMSGAYSAVAVFNLHTLHSDGGPYGKFKKRR